MSDLLDYADIRKKAEREGTIATNNVICEHGVFKNLCGQCKKEKNT